MSNGDNQPTEEAKQAKLCPFFKCPCIGNECELRVEINMMKPSMPVPQKISVCVFPALLMILGTPVPQPAQIVKMPNFPPGFNPFKQ